MSQASLDSPPTWRMGGQSGCLATLALTGLWSLSGRERIWRIESASFFSSTPGQIPRLQSEECGKIHADESAQGCATWKSTNVALHGPAEALRGAFSVRLAEA